MELIKKINNNFALGKNAKGKKIIVEGRGIGFMKMPCQLTDLSKVTRIYSDMEEGQEEAISQLPEEVLALTSEVVSYANRMIGEKMNPNLTFILADHIAFSIERAQKKMNIRMPISGEIRFMYPKETEIARYAMDLIRQKLMPDYPDSELTGITLNIINSEIETDREMDVHYELLEKCRKLIEKTMNTTISPDSFNYTRFSTHMAYLLQRAKTPQQANPDNFELYMALRREIPKVEECAERLKYLLEAYDYQINVEEKLYLMLHINRLCSREDCHPDGA